MDIKKIIDPLKVTTDPALLSYLAKTGIDPDYVEFTDDYGTLVYKDRQGRDRRNLCSKRYLDHASGKRFTVVSGLPMCRQDGTKLIPGFDPGSKTHYLKTNLMEGEVTDTGLITLEPVNDQPAGVMKNDILSWNPTLYLDGVQIAFISGPVLLSVDPWNGVFTDNVLVWDYGICKRLIRIIQGKLKERWVFTSNPGGAVRIVHNHSGKGDFRLGQYAVDSDVEEIPATVFTLAEYPFEIETESTFYPDAHEETATVDGRVYHYNPSSSWATLRDGAGTHSADTGSQDYSSDIYGRQTGPLFDWIVREIFLFDISDVGEDIISAGALSHYCTAKKDEISISPSTAIVASAPNSNTALLAGDYDSLGTTLFSNVLAYGSWNIDAYNPHTMNSTGIAFLQAAVDGDGIAKLGMRENEYDLENDIPSPTGDGESGFEIYFADNGTNKPKLVLTHSLLDVDESAECSFELEAFNERKLTLQSTTSLEAESSMGRKLGFPGIVSLETEASMGRKLGFSLSTLIEIEATGPLHILLLKSAITSFEVETEAGRHLQLPLSSSFAIEAELSRKLIFPLSSLIEMEADGTFRAGLEKSASVLIEMEAAAGRHLRLPLSAFIEMEAVAGRHLIKSFSALIEIEAVGELAILIPMVRKQQLLLEITTEEQVTH